MSEIALEKRTRNLKFLNLGFLLYFLHQALLMGLRYTLFLFEKAGHELMSWEAYESLTQVYVFAETLWFIPYILAFYSLVYLRSREQHPTYRILTFLFILTSLFSFGEGGFVYRILYSLMGDLLAFQAYLIADVLYGITFIAFFMLFDLGIRVQKMLVSKIIIVCAYLPKIAFNLIIFISAADETYFEMYGNFDFLWILYGGLLLIGGTIFTIVLYKNDKKISNI